MKAVIYKNYGSPDVLQLVEVVKPIPQDNEVLIKIHATTVTSADWRVRSMKIPVGFGLISRLVFGISKPRQPILGTELAGEVESVGKNVSNFQVGDRVLGFSGAGMGCHAEYKCLPADGMVVLKPDNLSYEEAAAISFGGTTAWDFLRRGKLQSGEKVLVNGAAGCVGTAAVQLAKYLGADVTGVCSTANLELVQSLGADRAIDYTKEDFTANGQTYDIIVDTVGTAPFARVKNSLTAGGRLLQILAGLPDILIAPLISITGSQKAIAGPVAERVEDVQLLANLAAVGSFKPYIDRSYPFDRIAEAHSYVDTGHKRGNVVITLGV
jgi:NADPH:quinone reductase-like Zn-dependent oxidoreductase